MKGELRELAYRASYESLRHSEGFDWSFDAGLLAQAGTRQEIVRSVDAALAVIREEIEALPTNWPRTAAMVKADVLALFEDDA